MELSSLIGKEILTPTGDKLGYAKSAYVSRDYKRLSSLVCIDEDEEEFYLPARAVLASDDVIIAGKGRLSAPTGTPCPIGVPAYSEKGENLGAVGDLLVGDGDPVYVIVKDGIRTSYAADCVVNGKTIIVYPEGKPRRTAPKKAQPAAEQTEREAPPATPQAVAEQTQPALRETAEQPAPQETTEQTPPAPASAFDALNRCNLLGRRVKKSVYDENGAPIAVKDERITPEILSCARRHNRLLQLTVNTLTNIY